MVKARDTALARKAVGCRKVDVEHLDGGSFRGAGPWATATADEIIEHVRGQIARYKVSDYIDFVAELPRTFTGKIQK